MFKSSSVPGQTAKTVFPAISQSVARVMRGTFIGRLVLAANAGEGKPVVSCVPARKEVRGG